MELIERNSPRRHLFVPGRDFVFADGALLSTPTKIRG